MHETWAKRLLLGAYDWNGDQPTHARQLLLCSEEWSVDIPDLSKKFDIEAEPVWQWLERPWPYPIPPATLVITDLAALKGDPILHAARRDIDDWELFADNLEGQAIENARAVPFSTLIAIDPGLVKLMQVEIGTQVTRLSQLNEWRVLL